MIHGFLIIVFCLFPFVKCMKSVACFCIQPPRSQYFVEAAFTVVTATSLLGFVFSSLENTKAVIALLSLHNC